MLKNILIIRWSGMGDIIMSIPALKWLKTNFPNINITYLTDTQFARIPEISGLVDKTFAVDRRGFETKDRFIKSLIGTLNIIKNLRKQQFDLAFDLQGFGETAILAFLSGAPLRAGRIKKSPLRKKIYNIPITADWEGEHRALYFVRAISQGLGEKMPQSIDNPKLSEPLSANLSPKIQRIGLNLGASTESRRWNEKKFFELADLLSNKGFLLRLFTGPQEKAIIPVVKKACAQNRWEFSFQSDLDSLIHNLAECTLVVSNDTGPGHLAAALDIPVVTLFSTGDPDNVKPLTDKGRWLRNRLDINQIQVTEVEKACLSLI